jgi:hypothetical protein
MVSAQERKMDIEKKGGRHGGIHKISAQTEIKTDFATMVYSKKSKMLPCED